MMIFNGHMIVLTYNNNKNLIVRYYAKIPGYTVCVCTLP